MASLLVAGLVFFLERNPLERGSSGAPGQPAAEGVRWESYSRTRLEEAGLLGKKVILYFSADWCRPCRDLQRGTFRDRRVVEVLEPFVLLKVDLTRPSPEADRVAREYQARSIPLIVILSPQGRELGRVMGSVPPSVLLQAILPEG